MFSKGNFLRKIIFSEHKINEGRKIVTNRPDLLNTGEEISEEEESQKHIKEQRWERRPEGNKVQGSLN